MLLDTDESDTPELRQISDAAPTYDTIVSHESLTTRPCFADENDQEKEMTKLVEGAEAGDHFVFYCKPSPDCALALHRTDSDFLQDAGHGAQVAAPGKPEDDGCDESAVFL